MLFTPPVPSFRFRLLTPTPLPRSPLRARTIANATSCCTSGCGNTTAHRASATLFASTRCIATVSLFSLLQKPRYQTDLRSPICPQIAARLASRASSNSAPRASCLTTKASPSCNPPSFSASGPSIQPVCTTLYPPCRLLRQLSLPCRFFFPSRTHAGPDWYISRTLRFPSMSISILSSLHRLRVRERLSSPLLHRLGAGRPCVRCDRGRACCLSLQTPSSAVKSTRSCLSEPCRRPLLLQPGSLASNAGPTTP